MSFIFFTHAIIFLFFLPRMAILYGLRFFLTTTSSLHFSFLSMRRERKCCHGWHIFLFRFPEKRTRMGRKGSERSTWLLGIQDPTWSSTAARSVTISFAKRNALFCITDFETRKNLFFLQHKKNNTKQNIFYGSFSDTLFSSIPSAQQESLSAQNSFFLVPSVFRTSSQTFLTFLFVSNWHTAVATNNSLDSLLLTVIDITIKL